VTSRLGESGLLQETENDWRRVVIEKPFGQDLESAVALNRKLHDNLDERQIYRINHYLGKETVQNIMVFRFANGFIEPLWNHHHIDHVQLTVAESVGVEHRRAYYVEQVDPNMLVLRIQPAEGIQMSFSAKVPGPTMGVGTVDMDFCYEDYFGNKPATGYETLIYDCMNGDVTLYKHADTVEKGWEIVQSVMGVWAALPPRDFPNYAAGTWGPTAAGGLLKNDGRLWRRIKIPNQ